MARVSRFLSVSLLLIVGLAACTADEVGGPADSHPDFEVVEGVASSFASCSPGLVALIPGNGIPLSELTTLSNGFNNKVIDAPGLTTSDRNKLRRIGAYNPGSVPPGTLKNITVAVTSGSGSGWCGSAGSNDIFVWQCESGGPTNPTAFQNRRTTILHELWNILNSNTNKLSNWDAAAGCSLHPGSNPTTTVPCVHEVQYEYDFCAVRPQSLTPDTDLVTGVNISGPSSIDEDESAQYTAAFTQTGGGGPLPAVLGGDPDVGWSSSSHLSLSCTNCNPTTATGEQGGNGQLTATVPAAGNVVYPQPTRTRTISITTPPTPCSSVTFSPSSAQIDIGEVKTFLASSLGCPGLTASISPANGTAGFSSGSGCSLTSTSITSLFKVRGCNNGFATVTIRQNGAVIQTISLVIGTLEW